MHAKITSERFIGVGKIALGFYTTHSTKMPTLNKTQNITYSVRVPTKAKGITVGTFDTKLLIAQALVDLSKEQPLKKVSISDIVERTGKNRKTFYYHFEDKNALIIWKFRYDLGTELQRRFPENILVYEKEDEGTYPDLPFYITQKSGVRSLDHSKFFDTFAIVLERERDFYVQAFSEMGPSSLRHYLYDLYLPALRNDITIILANRYLPEENLSLIHI